MQTMGNFQNIFYRHTVALFKKKKLLILLEKLAGNVTTSNDFTEDALHIDMKPKMSETAFVKLSSA